MCPTAKVIFRFCSLVFTLLVAACGGGGGGGGGPVSAPGAATKLGFAVQPSTAIAGAPVPAAVRVAAQDASGNTATAFTGSVVVAIGTNPAGGTLGGTASVPAVNGVATFADLHFDKAGTGYTLTAAAIGLTGAA